MTCELNLQRINLNNQIDSNTIKKNSRDVTWHCLKTKWMAPQFLFESKITLHGVVFVTQVLDFKNGSTAAFIQLFLSARVNAIYTLDVSMNSSKIQCTWNNYGRCSGFVVSCWSLALAALIDILQNYLYGIEAIIGLPQCQDRNPEEYG